MYVRMQVVHCNNKELSCPKKFEAAPRTQSFGLRPRSVYGTTQAIKLLPSDRDAKKGWVAEVKPTLFFVGMVNGYLTNCSLWDIQQIWYWTQQDSEQQAVVVSKWRCVVVVQIRYRCIHLWSMFRAMFSWRVVGLFAHARMCKFWKVQNAASWAFEGCFLKAVGPWLGPKRSEPENDELTLDWTLSQ